MIYSHKCTEYALNHQNGTIMSYVILITSLLLIQYTFFSMRAGLARGKADIKAPAINGDEDFERKLRVQINTLEQLIITLPAMWVCAVYFRSDIAAALGTTFFIGRALYSAAYISNPASRAPGMIIGFLANLALIGCCLVIALKGIIP